MAHDDDEAWRAIVDNYGDRPALDPALDPDQAADTTSETAPDQTAEDPGPPERSGSEDGGPSVPAINPSVRSWDDDFVDSDWTTDRFVPPPPPPLPTTTTDRLAAWLGVFGAPLVLLVFLVLGISLPQPIPYLLVGAFVGGFLYLVFTMSREPRDPGDDGAVL